jgi:hypothetical protein
VAVVGLIPHLAHSVQLTGSPLGIVLNTSRNAVRAYLGEGLADYRDQFWWALAGWAGPIATVSALLGIGLGIHSRQMRRRLAFLLIPASLQVATLGLISHGEPRFLFFPIALVMVAGALGIERFLLGHRRGRALALGLVVVIVGSIALSISSARQFVGNRVSSNQPVQLASELVAAESGEGSCGVLTSYAPQVTYYSGCATVLFRSGADPSDELSRVGGDSRFLLLIENGKRQPVGPELEALVALTVGGPMPVEGTRRDGVVYRFPD